jgi:hypothetical protein
VDRSGVVYLEPSRCGKVWTPRLTRPGELRAARHLVDRGLGYALARLVACFSAPVAMAETGMLRAVARPQSLVHDGLFLPRSIPER